MKEPLQQIAKITGQQERAETKAVKTEIANPKTTNDRRSFIKKAALGGVALGGLMNNYLLAEDTIAQTPQRVSGGSKSLQDLKGVLPKGKLGNLIVSRMIMGCNPIIGQSHGRDLIYANDLMRAYNTEQKILETIHLGVQAGIDTLLMTIESYSYLNKYNDLYKSKIQGICMADLPARDLLSDINRAIAVGPTSIYIHGRVADTYIRDGKKDELSKAMDYIRKQGFQAGMGAHCIETVEVCEKESIPLDYYLKTFHHDQYWSALPEENRDDPYMVIGPSYVDHNKYHENMWDLAPNHTVEVMKEVKKPFIAFKILAAGAIQPRDGFRYAFENGADFILVGMFDWQVIDNVNTAIEVLGDLNNRERKWFS
jgi:hypothetical protein